LKTYIENNKKPVKEIGNVSDSIDNIENLHFYTRQEVERDFFSDVVLGGESLGNPFFIEPGEINCEYIINEIVRLNPDFVITYGCSILKPPLIDIFPNKIINVHLGLSPYYFGSGTNFHALVNNDLHLLGCTYMYIDYGVDTGEIIHHIRGKILPFDTPCTIGNRLIKKMTHVFIELVKNFEKVEKKKQIENICGKTYKRVDATAEKTKILYENFSDGACLRYLRKQSKLESDFPIIEQDFLK
jgi:methionyl-tRNA formyltransferase